LRFFLTAKYAKKKRKECKVGSTLLTTEETEKKTQRKLRLAIKSDLTAKSAKKRRKECKVSNLRMVLESRCQEQTPPTGTMLCSINPTAADSPEWRETK